MSKLRYRQILTKHGLITTPAFLPDATYGSINSVSFADAKSAGVEEIVTTTLHLELKLGADYISKFGGLHKFFNWDRPILTDSGGFQVFSLIHRRGNKQNKITAAGAEFVDPVTGTKYLLTPELSQEIQHKLGSDIRVVLDEPLSLEASTAANIESVVHTTDWARRAKQKFLELNSITAQEFASTPLWSNTNSPTEKASRPLLTAVVQGAGDRQLRKRSANELQEIGFDGYNFGGLPLTPEGSLDLELSEYLVNLLPEGKIRYAMGIGTPDDMIALAHMGWDIFDCVMPTRNARHGYLFVPLGEGDVDYKNYSVLHLKSERYKFSDEPIASVTHPALENVSRAYLRHLIRVKETVGFRLATLHNLQFYSQTMLSLRKSY